MVYLPHDIFRHILSFKAPRYGRVMNGDPCMATATRVLIIQHYCNGMRMNEDDIEDNFNMVRFRYRDTPVLLPMFVCRDPFTFQYNPVESSRLLVCDGKPLMFDMSSAAWTVQWLYPPKLTKLSLQSEACDPDLELYQIMHRR